LGICNLIREADLLPAVSRGAEALPKYNEANAALRKLQKDFPDWNSEVVRYRLSYLANRVTILSAEMGKPGRLDGATNAGPVGSSGPPADWEIQMAGLREQIRQLQADKALLEAKLKEALSVQPAVSDPRELARIRARVEVVEKENTLLAATLAQVRARSSPAGGFSPLETNAPAVDIDILRKAERERIGLISRRAGAAGAPAGATNRVVRAWHE